MAILSDLVRVQHETCLLLAGCLLSTALQFLSPYQQMCVPQAKANRGILYVDEVNLLDDGLVDVVLDSAASGLNTVEREGVSIVHPARFILIGSGNPQVRTLGKDLVRSAGGWGLQCEACDAAAVPCCRQGLVTVMHAKRSNARASALSTSCSPSSALANPQVAALKGCTCSLCN